MNQKCAFTICAKNFIGLAQTLEKSLRGCNPDADFVIFIVDEFDGCCLQELSNNVITVKDNCNISSVDWLNMSFKYDIVELCTAVKPFCMRYLLDKGYEIVMYFDPDILVFAPLTPVYAALEHHKVVVTPHRIDINNDNPCRGGIYNLGFLGVRESVSVGRMLLWWSDRLRNHASVDPMRGLFTDQKWMDQLPVVLENDELFVSRHPGLNYAPWNFDERQVVKRDKRFFVRLKSSEQGCEFPLVFLHYSSFKFKEICQGNYNHKYFPMANREAELFELIRIYGERLSESNFMTYLELRYSYDVYSDGSPIQYNHRWIYKRLCEEGYTFDNPFDVNDKFFNLLRNSHMLSQAKFNPERNMTGKVANVGRKVMLIDFLTSVIIRVMGYPRFTLLARFMIRYLHLSNRIRFLGPEFRKYKIESF